MISTVKRINLRNCNRQISDLTRNQSMIIQVTASLLTPDSLKALIGLLLLLYQLGARAIILRLQALSSVNCQILLSTKVLKKSLLNLFLPRSYLNLLISMEACMWENPQESPRRRQLLRKLRLQARRKTQRRWSSFRKLKISTGAR